MAWKKAIEVKVLVNGTPAQEYNDDEGESGGSPTVTKYIEAISGAEFAVQYELKRSLRFKSELLYIEIYIDGKSLDGELIERAAFEQNPRGYTRSLDGITRSYGETWSLEKFKFSEIKISDDHPQNSGLDLKDRVADIGIITLMVHRKHKGVLAAGVKGSGWDWDELGELGQVPEKALKGQALSHETSLGAPQFVAPRGTWVGSEYLDGKDRPFAVFNFKYRSRSATTLRIIARFEADSCHLPTSEALQDLRIIPRTPTPVPLEDRPLEELTAEEMRELLRRQRERQGSTVSEIKAKIKAERGIKREYEDDEEYDAMLTSARTTKVARRLEEGEVIDLSED